MAVIRLGNLLWRPHTRPISPTDPVDVKDVNSDAIKNKVDTLATETKLEQVRTLLAGVATEDKLEQARALLQTISGKDFATQTTLAQVKSELELVKAELQEIKANQLSGDQKVQLSGTIVTLLPRERRTANTTYQVLVPPLWAKGVVINLSIRGVTGTFAQGQGTMIDVLIRNRGTSGQMGYRPVFPRYTAPGGQVYTLYPGMGKSVSLDFDENEATVSQYSYRNTNAVIQGLEILFRISISGSFGEAEGVDCHAELAWIP